MIQGKTRMNRDPNIQKFFETADDSLHGIIGYSLYVSALQKSVDRKEISQYLPERSFQTTFSWVRYYNKQHLIETFEPPFLELYQCKILLVALTSVFEAVLNDFIHHLYKKRFIAALPKDNYKAFIEWAYRQALKAKIGEKAAIERLPISFGIIDNARRIRNLFIHNKGLFNKNYKRNAIRKYNIVVDSHPDFTKFEKHPKFPVIVNWNYLHRLILAHIEALHILHNQIQSEFFGVPEGYSYAKELKPIVYEKILWGDVTVRLIKEK